MASKGITQREAAERLRISTAWLRELTAKGIVSRNDDGSYPWPTVGDELEAHRKKLDGANGNGGGSYKDARTRKIEVEAELKELELARRRREFAHIDEVAGLVLPVLMAVDLATRTAPRELSAAVARKLGCTRAQAVAMFDFVCEDLRQHIRRAIEGLDVPDEEVPDGLPGRSALLAAGVDTMRKLRALEDLKSVPGIGPATERAILEALA